MSYDVAIIGAGVVGLACARELARRGRSVLLLERNARYGEETSSRNSGVIHAGIYYPTGSAKAELCVRGSRSLYQWCADHDVPFAAVGKYIVAVDRAEEPALAAIAAKAHANGAVEVAPCSLAELRAAEPNVRAVAALHSPRTGIVDIVALLQSLYRACGDGVDVAFRRQVVGVERAADGWSLTARDPAGEEERVDAAQVVNAAGLDADEIAALAGFDLDACGYRQSYVKGSYFRLRAAKSSLARHLVYPVPPPDLPGLGVHVTVELDGSVRLGPDIEPIPRTRDYRVDESKAAAFAAAASRYLDGITAADLTPDQAGIRPKLPRPAGGGVPDFIIREESAAGHRGWVNLLGIESPGLTCCLENATRVADLL